MSILMPLPFGYDRYGQSTGFEPAYRSRNDRDIGDRACVSQRMRTMDTARRNQRFPRGASAPANDSHRGSRTRGAGGPIRTDTEHGLSVLPLPVGLRRHVVNYDV